jgi:hypothetical protein
MVIDKSFAEIILKYLQIAGRGVTTRKVAEKTRMSWMTAKKYLAWMNEGGIIEFYTDNGKIKWQVREEMVQLPTKEQLNELFKSLSSPTKLKKFKKKYNP